MESLVGTTLPLVYGGMRFREASQVRFVDDRPIPRNAPRSRLPVPIEIGVHHHAFRHERRAITLIERQVLAFGADGVGETFRRSFELADVRSGVGVEHQLIGVEAMTGFGLVGPMDPETINRPRSDSRYVAVPEAVGVFRKCQPLELALSACIE